MEKLKQFMREHEVEWNWDVSKSERLYAWIPYPQMERFIALPEVACALFDLGTIEAEFSSNSLCVDLSLFYDVSLLREAFPQSFFQNKSKGELLTIMDDYDEYIRAFKQLREPEQAPMELREFYEHGCQDLSQHGGQPCHEPGWVGPGLEM